MHRFVPPIQAVQRSGKPFPASLRPLQGSDISFGAPQQAWNNSWNVSLNLLHSHAGAATTSQYNPNMDLSVRILKDPRVELFGSEIAK